MRITAIAREAWRDILSGTARTGLTLLVTFALILPLQYLYISSIAQLVRHAHAFRDSGGATLVLQADGRIDGRSCDALSQLTSVHAGAMRKAKDDLRPETLPRSTIPTYEVTPTFLKLVGMNTPKGGIVITQDVAELFGITGEDSFLLNGSATRVADVLVWPDDGRRSELSYAVFVPVIANGTFDECWASSWPQHPVLENLIRTAVLPSAEPTLGNPTLAQLNSTQGASFDGPTLYRTMPVRLLIPSAVLLIVFLIGYATMRMRRLEFSSDLHAGMTRQDLLIKCLLEAGAWSLPILPSLEIVTFIGTYTLQSDERLALMSTTVLLGFAASGAALLGIIVGISTIKERRLFTYFKKR